MIPKIIWIYWDSGFESAHKIVKYCVESWKNKNPDWQIRLISESNLSTYINAIDVTKHKYFKLPIQKKANLIRLKLLADYGGVWVDATVYCTKPLSQWVFKHSTSGFFVFSNPGRDRLISNWFIAANPNNYIIKELYKSRCEFWSKYDIPHQGFMMKKVRPLLNKILNQKKYFTLLWFTLLFTRIFKMYPYVVFHYDFYRLLQKDQKFKANWNSIKHISAKKAHTIQKVGMLHQVNEETIQTLRKIDVPVFKLGHKFDETLLSDNALVMYLFKNY